MFRISPLSVLLLALLVGCHVDEVKSSEPSSAKIERVQAFRAAYARGDLEAARGFLSEDPRRWWERREGPGQPWILGTGPWKHWDEVFESEGRLEELQAEVDRVSAIAVEHNDYYRLLERGPQRHRQTWFFDEAGSISGFLIEGIDDAPDLGRTDEFLIWAKANDPETLAIVRPNGEIDPAKAERHLALLERWRQATQ
ncbi:MAG: hypothetical protein RL885_11870 [Planctomycetota bacterium]